MTRGYEPPEHNKPAFHCPNCGVLAKQSWYYIYKSDDESINHTSDIWKMNGIMAATCQNCYESSIWMNDSLVYPSESPAPLPSENMPENVQELYEEASSVVSDSPRAAAALLRLAIENLVLELEAPEDESLYQQIGFLVDEKGLHPKVQKSLDGVRIVGNESVHPGELDMKDNEKIALALFDLINIIVESVITEEKQVNELYEELPESKKEGVEDRDG